MEATQSKDNTWLLLALAGIGIYWYFTKKGAAKAVPVTTAMPVTPAPAAQAPEVPVLNVPSGEDTMNDFKYYSDLVMQSPPVVYTPSVDAAQTVFEQPIYTTFPVYEQPAVPVTAMPTPEMPSMPVEQPVIDTAPYQYSGGGGGIIENLASSQYAFMDQVLQTNAPSAQADTAFL